jgi:hypothetical protein
VREQRVSVHDQVTMLDQKAIDRVGQVTPYLKLPGLMRFVYDAGNLHATTRQVDDEQHMKANQASLRDASTVKKSIAAMAPQCARKKALHEVRFLRSGAGSTPPSSRMR